MRTPNLGLSKRVTAFSLCSFLVFLLFFKPFQAQSLPKPPLVLTKETRGSVIDSSYFMQLDSIGPGLFAEANDPSDQLFFNNKNPQKSYWYCFTLKNEHPTLKEWLLVSYNYAVDEIDVWSDYKSGPQVFRHTMGVYDRNIMHKQPVFEIQLAPGESKTLYVRIKNAHSFNHVFAVFSYPQFFEHFFKEYLLYGLFYGFMFFVIVYCAIHAAMLKDKVIALYTLFIVSQVLHMMFRDGTGLFLVPYHSEYSDSIKSMSRGFFGAFLLLYTTAFLKIDKRSNLFWSMVALALFRAIYTLTLFQDTTHFVYHIEMFSILLCTLVSFLYYKKGYKEAKYLTIGLSLLSLSYLVYYLSFMFFSTWTSWGFFGLYYGVAFESIFMTLALTNRFRKVQLESFKKEQMNKELEQLVEQRTTIIREQKKALEERSDELNLFLYSMSHDFKGPLKSIEGLCNIGTMDKRADHVHIYDLIVQRLKNLESNINDLKQVSTLKNEPDSFEKVDFAALHQEMMERFREMPGFDKIIIHFNMLLEEPFCGDAFSVRCIYQNLFENAIKFRDSNKSSFLLITVRKAEGQVELSFEDNGEGIPEGSQAAIFNMFFRASENAREDTGMGLFISKLAAEKLGGAINVQSTPGEGSTFEVVFPFSS